MSVYRRVFIKRTTVKKTEMSRWSKDKHKKSAAIFIKKTTVRKTETPRWPKDKHEKSAAVLKKKNKRKIAGYNR